MKKTRTPQRALAALLALILALSLTWTPAMAAEADEPPSGSFVNTSGDGGENAVSLAAARTFKASIPVDMSEEEAAQAAENVLWTLTRDENKPYQDKDLYPGQTQGGELTAWNCSNGETPLFSNVETAAETVDGQVYLTVTFENSVYFMTKDRQSGEWTADPSAPHANGGAYTDMCGWFDLTALLDDAPLGSVNMKVAPYDSFHLMSEVYEEIDAMVDFAAGNTDLYVEKFSMGSSAGDNGQKSLDMPYLIVAKDKAAVEKWKSIKAEAESDPSGLIAKIENGSLGDYQVPVMYSNIHANEVAASDGILEFAWMLLKAAAGEGVIDYDKLTGFTAEGEAELAKQMGPAGEADSVAVPDLVKDTATYLGYIKAGGSSISAPVDLERYYTIETETVYLDALLEDVFFLIVPEENVEGRTYLTRTSSGGFDLNRDNSFQTQAETQNMTALIAQWNPVSFTEFHGRVQTFQCEPCDPPHEPNFEYDLLAEHLMTGGEALGIAAVANNDGYNSYVIPQRDYLSYTGEKTENGEDKTCWYDPWDDMSTSYTPQYAMLHGTVAYTGEVPAYNDHTVQAVAYGQLGQSHYIAENKESYLLAQTRILERGVTNANSNAYELVGQWFCDQYDVEGAESELFRPVYDGEGQNGNFYPECYIIPLDGENQSNLQDAYEMVEYLIRNGVKVHLTGEAVTYDGAEYPAGTAVVSMYQAKRSVANSVLYDGTVITGWPVLYSEGITAFSHTRGFDMAVCAENAAYEEIMDAAGGAVLDAIPSGATLSVYNDYGQGEPEDGEPVVLRNSSQDSTAAVNALLKAGKSVSLIPTGRYAGNFLVSAEDWRSVSGDYIITGEYVPAAVTEAPSVPVTRAPVVYICGKPEQNGSGFVDAALVSGSYEYNYDRQAIAQLGFEVTTDPAAADIIIGAAAPEEAALAAIKSGTPYIGYGRRVASAAASLFPEGELVRETVSASSMDALAYVTYPAESLVTASYVSEGDGILYGYGAGYFAAIPEGAEVLVQIDGSREPLEGFLCADGEHFDDFLNNSVQAIAYKGEGAGGAKLDVVLFANTLTNKVHQHDEFNFISNAAFAAVAGTVEEEPAPEPDSEENDAMTLTYTPAESSAAVTWADLSAVNGLVIPGGADSAASVTREEAVEVLYRTAVENGMDAGTMAEYLNAFSDRGDISTNRIQMMNWAVGAEIILGRAGGTIDPKTPVTQGELALMIQRFQPILSSLG